MSDRLLLTILVAMHLLFLIISWIGNGVKSIEFQTYYITVTILGGIMLSTSIISNEFKRK
jgi:hypothetical protein